MAISVNVIEILNDSYQLEALPIGESLVVSLSAEVDIDSIDKYIQILNTDSSRDVPNLTGKPFLIQDEFEYKLVPSSYSIEQIGSTYKLTVTPDEMLKPESIFYLAIHKNLPPLHFSIEKTVSIGPSRIGHELNTSGISEDAVYTVEITSQSNLANSQHIIGFDILKDAVLVGSYSQNLKETNLFDLNGTDSVVFDVSTPYLVGETFEITLQEFTRLGTTLTQKFTTIIENDVIENPVTTSSRLSQSQILEFYEGSKLSLDNPYTTPEELENALGVTFSFLYPNKIRMSFDKGILISAITDDFIDIDISYAFGNYLLGDMGMYSEDQKYIITYTITPLSGTPTLTKRIDLLIEYDTDDLVPEEDKYILQAAV